jgi:hypothetical protein
MNRSGHCSRIPRDVPVSWACPPCPRESPVELECLLLALAPASLARPVPRRRTAAAPDRVHRADALRPREVRDRQGLRLPAPRPPAAHLGAAAQPVRFRAAHLLGQARRAPDAGRREGRRRPARHASCASAPWRAPRSSWMRAWWEACRWSTAATPTTSSSPCSRATTSGARSPTSAACRARCSTASSTTSRLTSSCPIHRARSRWANPTAARAPSRSCAPPWDYEELFGPVEHGARAGSHHA